MNNNVITTSPNIQGNIGSCQTKSITEKTGNTFFTETYTVIMTNSCSGEVVNTQSYVEYGGGAFSGLIAIVIFFVVVLNI